MVREVVVKRYRPLPKLIEGKKDINSEKAVGNLGVFPTRPEAALFAIVPDR
jgi:hypothetical protein